MFIITLFYFVITKPEPNAMIHHHQVLLLFINITFAWITLTWETFLVFILKITVPTARDCIIRRGESVTWFLVYNVILLVSSSLVSGVVITNHWTTWTVIPGRVEFRLHEGQTMSPESWIWERGQKKVLDFLMILVFIPMLMFIYVCKQIATVMVMM